MLHTSDIMDSKTLCGKSQMLQQLQESHSNLMEVHRYQEEVQMLQRQLIKLQEIQYLKEVSQLKTDENDNDEIKSTSHETFQQNELNDRKFNSPEFSTRGSNSNGNTSKAGRNDTSATDNAILPKKESLGMKFHSLESGLGTIGKLLLEHDSDGGNFSNNSRTFADQENLNTGGGRTSTFDDDDEKIYILKETLSSHRQSIEDLSGEVIQLRKEKSELLSYVKSMLGWRNHVEELLAAAPCENSQGKNASKEINVIMPYNNDTNNNDTLPKNTTQSRHVRLNLMADSTTTTNVSSKNSGSGMDEELKEYYCEEGTDTKLKERSRRLWETACRFFTPQQSHFILTAPLNSSDQEECDSSSALDDN